MDMAEKALPHYFGIRRGGKLPYFRICGKVRCERDAANPWEEHSKAMEVFESLKDLGKAEIQDIEEPGYSLLELKRDIAYRLLGACVFCERRCNVDRKMGQRGWCRVGDVSHVSSMFEHTGEEHFLIPSGTIFFSGCTWECAYCQNWGISQSPERGDAMGGEELAAWLDFRFGAGRIINANFVGGDPTPNLHTILDTLLHTRSDIPMIWNSNMYMSTETVKLLDGAMDAYLADFRYGNDESAMGLSKAPRYMETITRNFKAIEGRADMIVRILVLPGHVESDAVPIIDWLSENMPGSVYVNLMSQYFPQYKARGMEGLDRPLKREEFSLAAQHLKESKIRYHEVQ